MYYYKYNKYKSKYINKLKYLIGGANEFNPNDIIYISKLVSEDIPPDIDLNQLNGITKDFSNEDNFVDFLKSKFKIKTQNNYIIAKATFSADYYIIIMPNTLYIYTKYSDWDYNLVNKINKENKMIITIYPKEDNMDTSTLTFASKSKVLSKLNVSSKPIVKELLYINNLILCLYGVKEYEFTDMADIVIGEDSILTKAFRLLIGKKLEEISIYRSHPGNIYKIEECEDKLLLSYLYRCYRKCTTTTLNNFITELNDLTTLIKSFNKETLIDFYFNQNSFLNCFQFIIKILDTLKCKNACSEEIIILTPHDELQITDYRKLFEEKISLLNQEEKISPNHEGKISHIIDSIKSILECVPTEKWLLESKDDILLTEHMNNRYPTINSHNISKLKTLISQIKELDDYVCSLCFENYERIEI
jgi:hypothetical protein